MKINYPLLALAIGAFGIGTTEFSPMGLLPVIARGVDVSIPAAGMLISAYAVGVMVGAPLMTLLLSHRARRSALIFLMAIFTLGNVLSAIAPDYMTLMLSRILTSLNHGAFFGLGSVVAASVVPKHKQASAVATMFMGLTLANIGGVPAATWLGETIGWRMSFLATAGLGVISMVSLFFSLPKGGAGATWKYPSCILRGDNSIGEFYSVALTSGHQQADTGTKMIHIGKNTKSTIISKGISAGHSQNSYRGLVKIMPTATNARNFTQCDSMLIGANCGAHTFPYVECRNNSAQLEHEATTSRIGEDQLFYCLQRGISEEDAISMIVNGFCKDVFSELPLEFAVEAQKLLAISLEHSVG
ncbi:MFS transporter [Escherichia coli]